MELVINSRVYGSKTIIFDEEDADIILSLTWRIQKSGSGKFYPFTSGKTATPMATVLLGEKWIDHISGDTLDHRRSNLRRVTPKQNTWNKGPSRNSTIPFKGVCWNSFRGRFTVSIARNGERIFGGHHTNIYAAALRYNQLAVMYYGEFAWLNPLTKEQVAEAALSLEAQKNKRLTRSVRPGRTPPGSPTKILSKNNSTGYRGVVRCKKTGCYRAQMPQAGGRKTLSLGGFITAEGAAKAYDAAVVLYGKPLSHLNFPHSYQQKSI